MPVVPRLSKVAVSLKNGVAMLKYSQPKTGNALSVPLIKARLLQLSYEGAFNIY